MVAFFNTHLSEVLYKQNPYQQQILLG